MAKLNKINFRPTYGTYGNLTWYERDSDTIFTNRWKLLPSLENNIFYVDNISVVMHASFSPDYASHNSSSGVINRNDFNYAKSVSLEVEAPENIEVLLDKLNVVTSITENHIITFNTFVNFKTPLFKIIKPLNEGTFRIVFKIGWLDDKNEQNYKSINYIFYYNNCVEKGDMNGDGRINIVDVVQLADYLYDNRSVEYPCAGDMNGDGKVDLQDLLELANKVIDDG